MTKSLYGQPHALHKKMAAKLTHILNFKTKFHKENNYFQKTKSMLTMVDTLRLSA